MSSAMHKTSASFAVGLNRPVSMAEMVWRDTNTRRAGRQALLGPGRLQAVLELELAIVAVDVVDPEGGKLHHGRPYIVPKRYLIANVTAPNAAKRPQTKLNFILNW